MEFGNNGEVLDSQYEDGDPNELYDQRYMRLLKMSRSAGSVLKTVIEAPRRIRNKAVNVIDQFDTAVGRM